MKPITKVFLVIATLVLCLVVWGAFFAPKGMLETAWNAVVSPVNSAWQSVAGDKATLLPTFDVSQFDTESFDEENNKGGGFSGN